MAIGTRESFTLEEWLLVPISQLRIHQWEGQDTLAILAPLIITASVGVSYLVLRGRREGWPISPFMLVGALAGFLFIGTGLGQGLQMNIALASAGGHAEALHTAFFAAIPLILGLFAIRTSMQSGAVTPKSRLVMIVLGVIALVMWAGLLVGPILAISAAFLPSRIALR